MSDDLVDRLRSWADVPPRPDKPGILTEAADRIAALEAEASEGERRGLERAIEAIEGTSHVVNVEGDMQAWCDGYDFAEEAAVKAIRALIPEAPAQPELASAAANQLSGSKVGEPAREGNPEDHPRYPTLLADAKARVRNENLDGPPRRHAVAKEGE